MQDRATGQVFRLDFGPVGRGVGVNGNVQINNTVAASGQHTIVYYIINTLTGLPV